MKLNYKRTFLVGFAFLSICAFWQTYDNIIPLMLQNSFGLGETTTGVLMAMDNVLAIFLLPIFGALSDKVDTRWGKRTPFIVVGTILAVIFYMILPAAANEQKLIIYVVALFAVLVSMGLYRSPAVALMPDVTPAPLRSKANAIINLMGAVGGVYALIMIKVLVGKGETPDYTPLFFSIAALMIVAVVVLVLTIHENALKKTVAKEVENFEKEHGVKIVTENESEEPSSNKKPMPADVKKSMYFLLASIFLWFTAYNAVTTAFSRYTMVVWKMEGGSFANCLMVATVAAILSYIPIGHISSIIGRKKTIQGGIVLMMISYFAVAFCGSYQAWINIAFAIVGVGWAAISVNSYPMMVEMGRGKDIGKFTGTYYTFSMAAQIFTPIFSGFLLEHVSYKTLFPYATIFSILAFITMSMVKHGDFKPEKKESVLEHFDVED